MKLRYKIYINIIVNKYVLIKITGKYVGCYNKQGYQYMDKLYINFSGALRIEFTLSRTDITEHNLIHI